MFAEAAAEKKDGVGDDLFKVEFDFGKHKDVALGRYRDVHGLYSDLVETARGILKNALSGQAIKVQSIEGRAKSFESFADKAAKPSDTDPNKPKYPDPMSEITDLAGIRVIAFQPRAVDEICKLVRREFKVTEFQDKSEALISQGKFGYQSFHFLVTLNDARVRLPEYSRFKDIVFEIQTRTVLQHAWAEMEHDIQYKTEAVIPTNIRRRFIALAGMLEMADREFESLQEADQKLREEARESVQSGELGAVEITPDSLKSYLDRRLGPDARQAAWVYDLLADYVIALGFTTLSQVDECIEGYDDDKISKMIYGSRMGQVSRFEDVLLASMGDVFVQRHPWSKSDDWVTRFRQRLVRLNEAGIKTGSFDPLASQGT
ncbi:GTP pyrophosphokinase [Paraburkholderia phenazinium]|uniref:PpGpp synthetase catalytic domain-containing protein (RelA/SpoT-type nucleotidyltranferase) n=1 Tax=Paraburkholderia phenazinium TaxID=60549 RepID=A0A1N6JWT4_9BURK|nr:hypothetical protein [Paraburkholderia phenazinium]SIO48804.1 ppGpp synthetase catalytic domain-containing protein (RelA/SpoT-type nucleotidyltranferase) [Paraburkholderia phenazinium]